MENKKVIKASFWYTVSSILLKGIGFITTPIFVRILTKSEFGTYSNIITWYSIITIIATINPCVSSIVVKNEFVITSEI